MKKKVSLVIGLAALAVIVYLTYALIAWLISSLDEINPSVGAAIIAGAATVFGSVLIASYNARRARERSAQEANRGEKARVYREFMDVVVRIMRNTKEGKSDDELLPEGMEEFFYNFTSTVTVYGGPGVVKAFGDWRSASVSEEPGSALLKMDTLFRAMREDLGESNKGLDPNELVGLFIIGGKSEIAKAANKAVHRTP